MGRQYPPHPPTRPLVLLVEEHEDAQRRQSCARPALMRLDSTSTKFWSSAERSASGAFGVNDRAGQV